MTYKYYCSPNYVELSRFDYPNILAGQGTMGLEILEQVPDLDAVVVPVGGGGLLAGLAVAVKTMKPDVKIIVSKLDDNYALFDLFGTF